MPKIPYRDLILADKPVGYWPLDELSGTTVFDRSGNGRNGTLSGSFVLDKGGALPESRSIDFASGAAVNILLTLLGSSYSYEAWIFPTAGSLSVADGIVGNNNTPRFTWGTSGSAGSRRIQFLHKPVSGTPTSYSVSTNYDLELEKWHHLVATVKDGNIAAPRVRIYHNGVLVSEGFPGQALTEPTAQHYIARRDSIPGLPGRIDEVAVYGYDLTSEQIKAHYLQGDLRTLFRRARKCR